MVTLRQIEAFRAVMITGTVTQAAAMLFVSQPAVSRILADLERTVGFKLFTRANRQLIPTDEARALYDEVERAFIGLQQIDQAATSIRQYRGGHFRLITIPSLASTVMSELIARFVEHYPEIVVSLEVRPSQRVIEWIVSQQCDMGLSSTPTDNANVTTRPIARADAVCVLPDAHPSRATRPSGTGWTRSSAGPVSRATSGSRRAPSRPSVGWSRSVSGSRSSAQWSPPTRCPRA